jgi:hypothetical protein
MKQQSSIGVRLHERTQRERGFCIAELCIAKFWMTDNATVEQYSSPPEAPSGAVDIPRTVRYSAEVLSYQRFEGPGLPKL